MDGVTNMTLFLPSRNSVGDDVIYFSFFCGNLRVWLRLCVVNVALWNDLRQQGRKRGHLNSPN